MSKFSDMLTYLRKRNGLSQQELADKVGMTRSAIGMYETAQREPDFETTEVFADFFNVNMDTLTGRTKLPTPDIEGGLSSEAKEVAYAYDQATEKEQRTVRLVLSDYLPDGTTPKDIAASNGPKELSREDVAQVIHPETSAELP